MSWKEYVDLVLKKGKKPITMATLLKEITFLKRLEQEDYSLSKEDKEELQNAIQEGLRTLEYFEGVNGYQLLSKTSYRKGRLDTTQGIVSSITSYINKEGKQEVIEEKIPIRKENYNQALDGDFVLVDVSMKDKSARVEKILERKIGNIMGEIIRLGNQFFVRPLNKKQQDLTILLEGNYIEGQIVIVSLKETPSPNFYTGKVIQSIHHKDDPHEEALIEAFQCGMPHGFSEDSMKQLDNIPKTVSNEEKEGRYDFTTWEIFSIDGSDTKDKDDCISLSKLPNGNYLLGVHIADVSHYVPTNSPIHKDAYRKGTSYYFGGSVEPQLPRELSNGICSLNDHVERLTKSVLIEYDKEGNVVSHSLVASIINSRIGMTYEKVNDILKNNIVDSEYEPYKETLQEMQKLYKKLRKKRERNGALFFQKPEIKFIYDEDGNAIDSKFYYQDTAEQLIEEFMLAANVSVAEILEEEGIPLVYRIHGTPNREKLKDYLRLLEKMGMPFSFSTEDICCDKRLFQALIAHIKEKSGFLETMLNTSLIRTMSHAIYSTENIGHYGTAFSSYCHFTSPIRRLADDTIGRMIDECYFEKDESKKKEAIFRWKKIGIDYANQASKMEMIEEKVEKNVNKRDAAVYFEHHIGEEYEAVVISLNEFGLEVQLNNLLEGIIPLGQEYTCHTKNFCMNSLTGPSYYVGDYLKVQLVSVDKEKKQISFAVVEKLMENAALASLNHYKEKENKRLMKKRNYS